MLDYGQSRTDAYSYCLVNPFTLQETGEMLEGIEGDGNITFGTDTDNGYSASLTVMGSQTVNQLVRIKHTVTLDDGSQDAETLGTFFVDGTSSTWRRGIVTQSLQCYSTMYRLSQDVLESDFTRPAGYNIVQEVQELVEADGGLLRVLPGVETGREHTIDIWFDVGTNKKSVLDQIGSWTSCEVGVDDEGYITWGPYVAPLDRAVTYTFVNGQNCVYEPGMDLDDTRSDAVNRVVAHFSRESKASDDPYGLADSVVVDLPDTEPYSYRVIGRHKTYDLEVSEPCTHDELTAQALRYLDSHKGSNTYIQISHVGIPRLRAGDVVRYINYEDGEQMVDRICMVDQISMTLGKLCMCSTKLLVLS